MNLTILLCSAVRLQEIFDANSDPDISTWYTGYPDGAMQGGNLTRYEEDVFKEYLQSLNRKQNKTHI